MLASRLPNFKSSSSPYSMSKRFSFLKCWFPSEMKDSEMPWDLESFSLETENLPEGEV